MPSPEDTTERLVSQYARTRDVRLRNELVFRYERLARSLAARFAPSGGSTADDLVQVAYVGLIGAIERYDPGSGRGFITFAVPTIMGCIKHHLRDTGWIIKAPRRLRELGYRVSRLNAEFEQRFGRSPTLRELALYAGVDEERLIQAMEVTQLYQPGSLDAPASHEAGEPLTLLESAGITDPQVSAVEDRDWLLSGLVALEERERAILQHRYFGELSQAEVARRLGVSQMHISRIERRAIARLRVLLA